MKRVKTKWVSRLDKTSEVLVEAGERVEQGQLVAKSKQKVVKSFKMPDFWGRQSRGKIEEWKKAWMGRRIEGGELLYKKAGLWGRKFYTPEGGVITGIDEWQNVLVEEVMAKPRELLAPVRAKVGRVDKDRVVLEFGAIELKGRGLVRGKTWGNMNGEEIRKMADINSRLRGRIVLVPEVKAMLLVKAEVVGVAGVVCRRLDEKQVEEKISIPVLGLEEKEWRDLKRMLAGVEESRVMINSLKDRLLVVVN